MRNRSWTGSEARLGEVFTSVLLLTGCAGDLKGAEPQEPAPATSEEPRPLPPGPTQQCPGITVAGISAPVELDGLELRMKCLGAGSTEVLAGTGCTTDECEQTLAALDAEPGGWDRSVQVVCHSYAVGYRGGEVLGTAKDERELVVLLGELDTPAEVQVLTTLKGFECLYINPSEDGFSAAVKAMIESCPVTHQEIFFEVGPDGVMREVRRGTKFEQQACIGRKPGGLIAGGARRDAETAAGAYLARAAELEAASVVSFIALKAELEAHEGPRSLIDRVVAAARDEVRHARVMTGLARSFGGKPSVRRIRVPAVRSLATIARENANEGCVTETWGALLGLHQAKAARSGSVRRAYGRVSRDEVRHAALSWDLHTWFATRLSPAERRRVRSETEVHITGLESRLGKDASREIERDLGLPTPERERALFTSLRRKLWSA